MSLCAENDAVIFAFLFLTKIQLQYTANIPEAIRRSRSEIRKIITRCKKGERGNHSREGIRLEWRKQKFHARTILVYPRFRKYIRERARGKFFRSFASICKSVLTISFPVRVIRVSHRKVLKCAHTVCEQSNLSSSRSCENGCGTDVDTLLRAARRRNFLHFPLPAENTVKRIRVFAACLVP